MAAAGAAGHPPRTPPTAAAPRDNRNFARFTKLDVDAAAIRCAEDLLLARPPGL